MAKKETQRQMIFTTEIVDKATADINNGIVLKRYQNPWRKNEVGIRREGISFRMTEYEQEEYIKCALDIHYFTEHYCKVKREDGSIGSIKLRNYQEDILDLFSNNRYSILMASRQIGKCIGFNEIGEFKFGDKIYEFRFGDLYYYSLSKLRKLTTLEKIKWALYNILAKL